ncbi:winged helix-turn-helix domain-containing protein [Kitasatospora sp. NPDC049285]|uniref:winged helix-turn-helix domain-containing protein n=1 Tax=Kitasatospora sp. NPDC049285 TaxID=3157096 RepID=UPI00343B61B4
MSTETPAACRFALSPLVETIATVGILAEIRPEPWRRAWLAAHQPAFLERLDAHPPLADWLATRQAATWPAELPLPPPGPDDDAREPDFTRLRATRGFAELLEWTWQHVVRPDWPHRRHAFRADIAARTRHAATHGWPAALPDVALPTGQPAVTELLFIPCSARHGWLVRDTHARVTVVYPTSAGPVPTPRTPPASLGRLLGAARAELLAGLDRPRDTAQLATLTGLSPAAIGDHLSILLDARLVARARSGPASRYYRTALADALLSAQPV